MIYIPVVFDDDLHEPRFIWHGILIPQLFAYIIGKSKCTSFLFCTLASVCIERNYTCVIGKTWFYITRYFECYGKEVTRKYIFAYKGSYFRIFEYAYHQTYLENAKNHLSLLNVIKMLLLS